MILLLLLQAASPPPHDALHYDITLVPSDTSAHVLGEVQITWRLKSAEPVRMQLDSSMRVIRVLVDGKPNTRISRTRYARSSSEIDVPHQKQAGDSISTRVRYRGYPRDGLITGKDSAGYRTVFANNRADQVRYWLPAPAMSDTATVSLHIQVPLGYRAVADGLLEKIDTLAYGSTMWHYRLSQAVPVHTVALGWVAGGEKAQ